MKKRPSAKEGSPPRRLAARVSKSQSAVDTCSGTGVAADARLPVFLPRADSRAVLPHAPNASGDPSSLVPVPDSDEEDLPPPLPLLYVVTL